MPSIGTLASLARVHPAGLSRARALANGLAALRTAMPAALSTFLLVTIAQPSSAEAPPLPCLILPQRVADLGNPSAGVVESIDVERGDVVRKGQVVARMRADVERASSSVASSRANSEADLRGAIAASELARLKLDRAQSLKQENFVSGQAVEQADSEYRVAHERVAQAREALATSAREVTLSQAQVSQRILRAPFDGVVIERYANPGERFELNPLLKIASVSLLKVELVAPTTYFGSLRLGQELAVQPDLPGASTHAARIVQIDRVLDPASNTFRVRLDLPNGDGALPAGLRCRIDVAQIRTPAAMPPAKAPPAGDARSQPKPSAVGAARATALLSATETPSASR